MRLPTRRADVADEGVRCRKIHTQGRSLSAERRRSRSRWTRSRCCSTRRTTWRSRRLNSRREQSSSSRTGDRVRVEQAIPSGHKVALRSDSSRPAHPALRAGHRLRNPGRRGRVSTSTATTWPSGTSATTTDSARPGSRSTSYRSRFAARSSAFAALTAGSARATMSRCSPPSTARRRRRWRSSTGSSAQACWPTTRTSTA